MRAANTTCRTTRVPDTISPRLARRLNELAMDDEASLEDLRAALESILNELEVAARSTDFDDPAQQRLLVLRDVIESHLRAELDASLAGVRAEVSARLLRRALHRVHPMTSAALGGPGDVQAPRSSLNL